MKRLLLFCIGLILAGLGVAMGSTPGLGTSPISSLPYVFTFIIPWSFGTTTIIINILFFLGQVVILKRRFSPFQIIQIPILVVFGFCIDLGMWLTGLFIPQSYILKLIETVAGCFILAVGVWLQIKADITLLPGDALVKVVADEYKFVFGTTKIYFDFINSILALICSLCFRGDVVGIREGTLIAAFLVGYFIRLLSRYNFPFSAKL